MSEEEQVEQELTQDEVMMIRVQDASKVQTTLNTPGWTELIRPELDRRREIFLEALLSRQKNMEDVSFAQQSILAIDELLDWIKTMLDMGKGAEEHFKKPEKKE